MRLANCCVLLVLAVVAVECKHLMGGYFVNWAQYRASPYTYKPDKLQPIASKVDHLMYAFAKFDDSFNIQYVEYDDGTLIPEVIAYKQQNPNLKVLIYRRVDVSVGDVQQDGQQPGKQSCLHRIRQAVHQQERVRRSGH